MTKASSRVAGAVARAFTSIRCWCWWWVVQDWSMEMWVWVVLSAICWLKLRATTIFSNYPFRMPCLNECLPRTIAAIPAIPAIPQQSLYNSKYPSQEPWWTSGRNVPDPTRDGQVLWSNVGRNYQGYKLVAAWPRGQVSKEVANGCQWGIPGLINIPKTMENHHLQ